MARYHSLSIYQLAREIVREVAELGGALRGFGDLDLQIQSAALSTVSNIAEGASSGSDRQFIRYLAIARGSANELQAQLEIASDLRRIDPRSPIHDRCDQLGRSISKFIAYLRG